MWWSSWQAVSHVLFVGLASYLALVAIQRVSGKRTLSKLNAFDLIVTVALGSTLATTLLSPDVSFADGVAGFIVLIGLQLAITFASSRFKPIGKAVKASPKLLVSHGRVLHEALREERVTEEEVFQAVRSSGRSSLHEVDVVLETNGKLSVVPSDGPRDALINVR